MCRAAASSCPLRAEAARGGSGLLSAGSCGAAVASSPAPRSVQPQSAPRAPPRCRGQHGGEDEAAGVRPEQEEGAGPPQPESLRGRRPPLLVRVSAPRQGQPVPGVAGRGRETPRARQRTGRRPHGLVVLAARGGVAGSEQPGAGACPAPWFWPEGATQTGPLAPTVHVNPRTPPVSGGVGEPLADRVRVAKFVFSFILCHEQSHAQEGHRAAFALPPSGEARSSP